MLAKTTARPLAQPSSLTSKIAAFVRFRARAAALAKAVSKLPVPVSAETSHLYRGYARSDFMTTTTRYDRLR